MFSLGREEEAPGDLTHMYKFLMGEVKKLETDSSLWCPVKGQEAMGTNGNSGNSI